LNLYKLSDCQGPVIGSSNSDAKGIVTIAPNEPLGSAGTYHLSIGSPATASMPAICINLDPYIYDNVGASVTIEQATSQADPTLTFPIHFNVTFNKPVVAETVQASSFVQTGNATGVEWKVTDQGDGIHFDLVAQTATAYGTVKPILPALSVKDPAGNKNFASTSVDNRVSYGVVVLPNYEASGSDWNDYVINNGSKFYNATGAGCTGTELTADGCLHAGEMKRVVLPYSAACSGLNMTDYLGQFTWTCDDSTGKPIFYSKSLKHGSGLRSLIAASGIAWKTNYVILTGTVSDASAALNWWPNNPVQTLPPNAGPTSPVLALSNAKTVYTLATSASSQGYEITASHVSLVTLNGSKLSYAGAAANNCNWDGSSSPTPTRCLIHFHAQDYLWLELDANGDNPANFVYFVINGGSGHNLQVRNSTLSNSTSGPYEALFMTQIRNSRMSGIEAGAIGFKFEDHCSGNRVTESSAPGGGFRVYNSQRNVFSQIKSFNGNTALDVQGGSTDNVFSQVTLANSDNFGIQVTGPGTDRNIFTMVTVANIQSEGIGHWQGKRNTFHNIVVANSGTNAMQVAASANEVSISHIVTTDTRFSGLDFQGTSNDKVSGLLLTHNLGADCYSVGGTAPGLTDGTCAGTDLSTSLTVVNGTGITSANSFVGKVTTQDLNGSNLLGSAAYPVVSSLFDWFTFSNPFGLSLLMNPYRGWGRDGGAAYPDFGYSNSWQAWSGTPGRIWDFSLLSTDTVLRNRTANGVTPNAVISGLATDPCPAWLSGNTVITDLANGEVTGNGNGICEFGEVCAGRTFLANAYEVIGSGGNDNGLCESGETCIAAPNFGAYQGHGDYTTHTCAFQDGTVSGVKMFYMPINGL
jgi:hypothetical protein